MSPEERELLTKSIELAEENNKLLRGMRRSARISTILRILYWVIIIITAFGTYYAFQPVINSLVESYNGMRDSVNSIKTITDKLPALPTWMGGKQ
jgi:hypothetical protein